MAARPRGRRSTRRPASEALAVSSTQRRSPSSLVDPHTPTQPPYKILPNADAVRARAAAAVAEVTAVLSVPDADAVRVLRHFKW